MFIEIDNNYQIHLRRITRIIIDLCKGLHKDNFHISQEKTKF